MKHLIPNQVLRYLLFLAVLSITGCQPSEGETQSATYFNHSFLTVADIDRSVKFYTTAFDLGVANEITSMKVTDANGSTVERDIRLVLLKFPGQNFVLEIGGRDEFVSDNAKANYAHLGVNVLDIESVRDRLVDAGAELVRPISLVQAGGIEAKTAFFLGPDGETIELMEVISGQF